MKKIISLAIATCVLFSAASFVFAEQPTGTDTTSGDTTGTGTTDGTAAGDTTGVSE